MPCGQNNCVMIPWSPCVIGISRSAPDMSLRPDQSITLELIVASRPCRGFVTGYDQSSRAQIRDQSVAAHSTR